MGLRAAAVTHPPSPAAPRIAERILARYLAAWGRSLLRAPGRAAGEEIQLVYVVAFAGAGGLPQGGNGTEGLLAAIRALDALRAGERGRGRRATPTVVLTEEDPVLCERVRMHLQAAGFADRLREAESLGSPAAGEIAMINAGFAALAPELLGYTAGPHHTLCFLDPPSPAKLPLAAVVPLLQQENTDLLIGFPTRDLHKQAPYRALPVADLPPHPKRIVEGYSAFFGDRRYEWVRLWRAAEREGGAEREGVAEARMLEYYRARLAEAAPRSAIRWVPIAPPGTEAAPLYLFLATEDPERALLLNRVLHEARLAGEAAWGDALSGFVREEESGVLDLFAPEAASGGGSATRIRRVDLPALAHEIATRFAGQAVPVREVLLELAETDLFVEEIRRALSLLRREGRVSYETLEAGAEIRFRG